MSGTAALKIPLEYKCFHLEGQMEVNERTPYKLWFRERERGVTKETEGQKEIMKHLRVYVEKVVKSTRNKWTRSNMQRFTRHTKNANISEITWSCPWTSRKDRLSRESAKLIDEIKLGLIILLVVYKMWHRISLRFSMVLEGDSRDGMPLIRLPEVWTEADCLND
jgi:hypothetical protein